MLSGPGADRDGSDAAVKNRQRSTAAVRFANPAMSVECSGIIFRESARDDDSEGPQR